VSYLFWSSELDTGIKSIDQQHKRIVEYINRLDDARAQGSRQLIGEVIDGLVDYTQSHFSFEEKMMEDAGYPLLRGHRRVHQMFIKQVADYQQRFEAGEDVAEELHSLLKRWLFNHIKHDDASYVTDVKASMQDLETDSGEEDGEQEGWLARNLRRFFGRSSG